MRQRYAPRKCFSLWASFVVSAVMDSTASNSNIWIHWLSLTRGMSTFVSESDLIAWLMRTMDRSRLRRDATRVVLRSTFSLMLVPYAYQGHVRSEGGDVRRAAKTCLAAHKLIATYAEPVRLARELLRTVAVAEPASQLVRELHEQLALGERVDDLVHLRAREIPD